VKDKRRTENGPGILIGWFDFPLEKDDTWEPIPNLTGSEHMICEFQNPQNQHTLDYAAKTASVLKQIMDNFKAKIMIIFALTTVFKTPSGSETPSEHLVYVRYPIGCKFDRPKRVWFKVKSSIRVHDHVVF
jgi:hypothetical protein